MAVDLPDGRQIELVTPAEKGNLGEAVTVPPLISPDGERIMFSGNAVLGDAPSLSGVTNPYVAERGPNGWTFHTHLLRPPDYMWGVSGALPGEDLLPDLSRAIWAAQTMPQLDTDEVQFFVSSSPRAWLPWSTLLTPMPGSRESSSNLQYRGGSFDFTRFVFARSGGSTAHGRYLEDDPSPVTSALAARRGWQNLYLVTDAGGPSPQIRLVNRNPDGSLIGPRCGAALGSTNLNSSNVAGTSARHAVSADGKTIYFTARPAGVEPGRVNCSAAGAGADGPAPARVFAHRDGLPAVQVSESQCARVSPACTSGTALNVDDLFEGASVNGQRVFFTTTRQLTDSDLDATKDLYAYDFDPPTGQPNLVQVSRGDDSAGSTAGNGAAVQGVLRFSDDGSRAYFVAHGKLTDTPNTRDQQAQSGQKNLYVWQRDEDHPAGRIAFIATLAAGDSGLWSINDTRAVQAVPNTGVDAEGNEVGGNGRYLLFASAAALTDDAPGIAADAFRYDDVTGEMTLVSPRAPDAEGNAALPVTLRDQHNRIGRVSYANYARSISEDGSVIGFDTDRALVAEDRNNSTDVYMWRDNGDGGTVHLISGGTYVLAEFQSMSYSTMTPDGRNFTFVTPAGLVPEDVDGGGDIYNARVDGGFPERPVVHEPKCSGDGCQGQSTSPGDGPLIGSIIFGGGGNVSPVRGTKKLALRVSKTAAVRGSSARLRVRVSHAGRISVRGASVKSATVSASRSGTYTVRVALSANGKRALARRGKLSVRARVAYRSRDGRSAAKTLKVTFKKAKASSATTRKGGR